MDTIISVSGLKKNYKIPVRKQGAFQVLKSLVHPTYKEVEAVKGLDFSVQEGEIVGFIGPNGAGKTTTLKMLSGLLYPTEGKLEVMGYTPYQRKTEYLKKIGMIMGNKSQLNMNITVSDSFHVTKQIYDISDKDYKDRLDELVELLGIGELLDKLPRNMSLGEKAKCEFASTLLYQPKIVYLDEPTLGMDVSVQLKLRKFIKEYNKKHNTTIILTSHYMADIMSLCSRVILINKGELVYDGNLIALGNKLLPFKIIRIVSDTEKLNLDVIEKVVGSDSKIIDSDDHSCTIRVLKDDVLMSISKLLQNETVSISDITIENPAIEAVIDQVYRKGVE